MKDYAKPLYADRNGDIVYRPPYLESGAFLTAWVLPSDINALQKVCDDALNKPSGGAVEYRPLFSLVLMVLADIKSVSSLDPEDSKKGWVPEQDICFWILTGAYVDDGHGNKVLDHIAFYIPYIWVTNAYTMATGRESFGFPKSFGWAKVAQSPDDPGPFWADGMVIPVYSPETEVSRQRLLEISRTGAAPAPPGGKVYRAGEGGTGLRAIVEKMVALGGVPGIDWNLIYQLIEDAFGRHLPMVFLKQYRDCVDAKAACYQAIIEANATVTDFKGMGFLPPDWTLQLNQYASDRIIDDLALSAGPTRVDLGFWVDYSFSMDLGREVWRGKGASLAKKVAVLGGGVSAMTAAFELTRPELAGQYDVTVYQMGWRLGGKGASGRNRAIGDRIEEHGLHIWMGFYENAFKVMQDAYAEVNRTTGPMQTWDEAFKKQSYIVLGEPLDGKEYFWQLDFPTNDCVPGEDPHMPTIWEMTAWAIEWLHNHWSTSAPEAARGPVSGGAWSIRDLVERLAREAEEKLSAGVRASPLFGCIGTAAGGTSPKIDAADAHGPACGHFARAHALAAASRAEKPTPEAVKGIIELIQLGMKCVRAVLGDRIKTDFVAFQIWVGVNLAGSSVIGILADNVIEKGWDSIDGLDLRDWLASHGADRDTTLTSGPIRGVYDLVFGYEDGDIERPRFAAGTAMRGMLRMAFAYKGAIFYKMQAGMGDTVFGPLYLALKKRGVKFRFFHRVTDVRANDGVVTAIDVCEQVQLTGGDYEPLIDVRGLPSWPSAPNYDQIQFGQELRAAGIDLESTWAPPWQYAKQKTLCVGEDFDLVVLGISVGALDQAAHSLLAASPPLQAAYANVKTVQTCAFQLWLKPDLTGLGWQNPPEISERPVLGGFVEPLDTWADMSQLLVRETWPAGNEPKNVAYFCGVLQQLAPLPPPSDHGFPGEQLARLDKMAIQFLNEDVHVLWPEAATATGFKWDLLVDLQPDVGEARFGSQYRRVNIDPTERYVLSLPGSTVYRPATDGTGLKNLYVTGDWIRCGLNAGCVEAACTAGMITARAISGVGGAIVGESDLT